MKTDGDSPEPQNCKRTLVIYGSKGKSDELLLSPQDPGHVCFLPRATDEFIVSRNIFMQSNFLQYYYYSTIFIITFLARNISKYIYPKIYIYEMLAWLLRVTYLLLKMELCDFTYLVIFCFWTYLTTGRCSILFEFSVFIREINGPFM